MRRRRERDVALAGEQARGRVEPDPAGARHVDLGPGVQVGEVARGAGGAVERLHVGGELDQVAGDEAGGETRLAQDLDQQPGRVAAGARALLQRLLRRLHPGLHADEVLDVPGEAAVQVAQVIDRARRRDLQVRKVARQAWSGRQRREVGGEIGLERLLVVEGPGLRALLDEEVERVDHGHVGDEVDRRRQLIRLVRHHDAGEEVAERVLLPVDEMRLRRQRQRVAEDGRAAVRGGAQPDHVGPEPDEAVVPVLRAMRQGDVKRHGGVIVAGWRKPVLVRLGSGIGSRPTAVLGSTAWHSRKRRGRSRSKAPSGCAAPSR